MLDVVLPVLDEAAALPWVLGRMPPSVRPLVVDNGSTDASPEIARGMGAKVVGEPRRGFGAACYAGLLAARAEVVCFMDCDGSLDPAELPLVAEPVARGEADLVLGARRAEPVGSALRGPGAGRMRGGSFPLHARLANRLLAWELRRRTGCPLTDLGPMRAARRAPLLALGIEDRRFGWPLEMVLRAARSGWRIGEVGVSYSPRTGRSKVTGTVRGSVRAVRDMAAALR